MKRIIFTVVFMSLAIPSFAADLFTPTAFYTYSTTKAAKTHVTLGKKAVRFKPSADITYKLNGSGTAYPVAANADEGPYGVNAKGTPTSSAVFYVTSSASTAKTKIYVQEEE